MALCTQKKNKPEMTPSELIAFRVANNMTVKQLAVLIGVTFQAVLLWESNKRTIPETTVRLVKLFQKYPQLIGEF